MNSDTHYIIHEEKVRHGFITKVIYTEKKNTRKKKKKKALEVGTVSWCH